MYILGISCFYHDSAVALIKDGIITCAAEEERFTRKKHDSSFPINSLDFCLNFEKISLDQVSAVVFYEKPLVKFDRILETFLSEAPRGIVSFIKHIPSWIKEKVFFKSTLRKHLKKLSKTVPPIYFSQHHLSHAASAFYTSSFTNAAVLCVDGVGEWATTSSWHGNNEELKPLKEIQYPHSLGLLYSTFTSYLGFKVNSGEYKLMGLAPYGLPRFKEIILNNIIFFHSDGSFQLNLKYFNFVSEEVMYTKHFTTLFGQEARNAESEFTQFHKDIAASIQAVLEEALVKLAQDIKKDTKEDNLCLAGGVALNCVANRLLKEKNIFKNIWIQPAAGDSGAALGAALAYYFSINKRTPTTNLQRGSSLGPSYSQENIQNILMNKQIQFEFFDTIEALNLEIVNALSSGMIIGYFQGKMEFGPRALGNRSILADARIPEMKEILNRKIKLRETFRPFAPIVLSEQANEYFQWNSDIENPYMLFTAKVLPEKNLPSITHVDGSARLQIVDKNIHSKLHTLLTVFNQKTHCPVLINTSFNVRGEPIVCSPEDAIRCFMTTEIDILVLENFIIRKSHQPHNISHQWKSAYAID